MRYAWDLYHDYLLAGGRLTRFMMRPLMHYLRLWDQLSARRPDVIVASSHHTSRRIAKYWHRDSTVIHPPVATNRFMEAAAHASPGDYFLCAGQLETYKRVDLAVSAFSELGLPLVIVGDGPQLSRLKRRASSNISFISGLTDERFARVVADCRALVFPGEEDFGMVPVEAMAAGRPVIAFGRGGALDSVVDGETGLFFNEQTTSALIDAVRRFESQVTHFDPEAIVSHARRYDEAHFHKAFGAVVNDALAAQHPRPSI